MHKLMVSIDGGASFVEAPEGVRVIYTGVSIPGIQGDGHLVINLSHEGVINDLWTTLDGEPQHNYATGGHTVGELIEGLVDES